jgi:hypothetical protein
MQTVLGNVEVTCGHTHREGDRVNLMVSRRGVRLEPSGNLRGVVTDVLFQQNGYKVNLEDGSFFYLEKAPQIGQEIYLHLPPSGVQCLA